MVTRPLSSANGRSRAALESCKASNDEIETRDQNKHKTGHFEIMFTWSVL
jgi:hypothetical protein